MKKYKERATTFTAFEINRKTLPILDEYFSVYSVHYNNGLTEINLNNLVAKFGDWAVESEDGWKILSSRDFHRAYEEVNE